MDYKYIEQLVERYFVGETTREEEQILRTFFQQEDVPASLQTYQDLFRYEQAASEVKISDDFDAKILSAIEHPTVKARRVGFTALLQPFYRAAAVVAIILTVGNAAQHSFDKDATEFFDEENYTSTFTEPATSQQVTTAVKIVSGSAKPDSLAYKEKDDL